jgi:hypothetical protein
LYEENSMISEWVSSNPVGLQLAPQRVQSDPQGARRAHLVAAKILIHLKDVLFFDIGQGLDR